MTTHAHDTPLKLCRTRPGFAVELAGDLLGIAIPDHDEVLPFSESATDQEVKDLNCDNVAVCRHGGANRLGIIIEVQRGIDDGRNDRSTGRKTGGKRYSWPAYVTNVRQRLEAPTVLVLVCPDQVTADWARTPIDVGHPGFDLVPLVLAPDNYPKLTEVSGTGALAEKMVVGTLIHARAPEAKEILQAAAEELAPLPKELAARYAQYMLGQLDERPRTILEALMETETYPYQSKLLADREARGEARGRAEGAEDMLLTVIEARGLPITANQRHRIEQCDDLDRLKQWAKRAISAPTVEDILT
ncbi:hypothetical protein [Glycomyces salinus]|uniref:hypothetical protein n=1 Tax=Glycomyces salinus TaxID=980294 RepID=UPI0018EDA09C|nr:hypothetical protein [Glycomyces salinus]